MPLSRKSCWICYAGPSSLPPQNSLKSKIKYSVFYSICVLMLMHYTVCYFTGISYAVVRQISMLFIDNKDYVFCKTFETLKSYWLLLGNSDCTGIDRMIAGEERWYHRVFNFMS